MTKIEPLVSVIIPIYHAQKDLKLCLDSIINQTYENTEILLMDDSPEDELTAEIISSYNDDRIKHIKSQSRLGLVSSLNQAIRISKGEFIARMDTDDISHIRRLEIQVSYMIDHPEVGVLGCNSYMIDERNHVIGCIKTLENDEEIKVGMIHNNRFIHPSIMIRRDLLLEELYDTSCVCCEDYELWSRLMKKTEFHNLQQMLMKYRVAKNSTWHSQLNRIKTDEDYYLKYLGVMKKCYDNGFSYFGIDPCMIDRDYFIYIFSKRIRQYSHKDKKIFLKKFYKVLNQSITNKQQVKCNTTELWIRMTKLKMFFAPYVWLIPIGVYLEIKNIIQNMHVMICGKIYINKTTYDWKI